MRMVMELLQSSTAVGWSDWRVCQNRHALIFFQKAPTFSSQGFVMS